LRKKILIGLLGIAILQLTSCGVKKAMKYQPEISAAPLKHELEIQTDSFNLVHSNFLQKNKYNNWELKVSGTPEEIGYYSGLLTQKLFQNQENAFFLNLEQTIPSKFKQKLVIKFLRWYNREMYQHIPDSYLREIYMLSQFSSAQYNWVAPKFQRALFLHGAHDIGHAMQDLAIVGCSSLAVWGAHTQSGNLLIGRNFDFYVGDAFAENKVIQFIQPEHGFAFASVSWPGMVGVVSGMNVKGITVTLNAAKSDIPLKAQTPVSIVSRQILEQAQTLEQAIAIAQSHKVFVSESLLIGSASENKAVVIEMSPKKFDVYQPNSDYLICTNHFQSASYLADSRNTAHLKNSHTQYRFEIIEQSRQNTPVWTPQKMANLLRSTQGINQTNIGLGNEKALNQLLAHHAVIFEPKTLKMWVSSSPFQLGAMVCYDLNEIFNPKNPSYSLFNDALTIAADSAFITKELVVYQEYKNKRYEIEIALRAKQAISQSDLDYFIALNPDFWEAYDLVGRVLHQQKQYKKAKFFLEKALTCEIPYQADRTRITNQLKKINKKI